MRPPLTAGGVLFGGTRTSSRVAGRRAPCLPFPPPSPSPPHCARLSTAPRLRLEEKVVLEGTLVPDGLAIGLGGAVLVRRQQRRGRLRRGRRRRILLGGDGGGGGGGPQVTDDGLKAVAEPEVRVEGRRGRRGCAVDSPEEAH